MSIKDKLIKFNIFTLFMLLPIIDSLRRTTIKDIEIFNIYYRYIMEILNSL